MPKKGTRSTKGKGEIWKETKSKKLTVQVTPTAWAGVKQRAIDIGLSVAEIFERFGRGLSLFGNDDNLDEQAILKNLHKLSNEGLKRVAESSVHLLYERCGIAPMGEKQLPPPPRIRDLISENCGECQVLVAGGLISEKRFEALKSGDRPTDEELSVLCACLNETVDTLYEIRNREFNGSDNHRKNGVVNY